MSCVMASWWASSLSPFMAWLQHSGHLSICGLCAGPGPPGELPGAARVTEPCAGLSLSVLIPTRPSLSSLSITSLAPSGTAPGLHLIPPPWSRRYLDPAIRGLFPLINKTLRVTPRVRDYLHSTRHSPSPDHTRARALCHCLLWLMSVTSGPGSGMRPRACLC